MTLPLTGAGPSSPAALAYLLRATFNAANQGFVDGQVLDTVAEGVPDGSLTVKKTSGTVEILSNELKLTGAATNYWGELGLYDTDAVTKTLGYALLCELQRPSLGNSMLGWHDQNTLAPTSSSVEFSVYLTSTGLGKFVTDTGLGNNATVMENVVASTWYELAFVLGGYDSAEGAYYSGAGGSYNHGCAVYVKGGVFTTWTLLWRALRGVANVYPQIQQYEGTGRICLYDNLRVPDKDLSAVLQPTCLSTFDAANGTSLDTASLPEVGNDWVEQSGNWDIQSNRANPDGAANATVDSTIADCIVDTVVNPQSAPSIIIRYADENNYWTIAANSSVNKLQIWEVNGGVISNRAEIVVTINGGTDYDLRGIVYSQTIDGFLNGVSKVSYGSAALNETATKHGLRSSHTLDEYDNFAVYPRTSATFDAELDSV